MIDRIYAILEPGADRVYYQHSPPNDYQRKTGAKVYEVEVLLPDWFKVDGRISAIAYKVTEEKR
jgi:hypothetical protein